MASVQRFGLAIALIVAAGCSDSPTAPSPRLMPLPPPAPAPPSTLRTTLTVRDGWTDVPVGGAQVVLNDTRYVTDVAGQVEVELPCTSATITAAGYLERRLKCRLDTFPLRNPVLTLWPIANDAERAAVQEALYRDWGLAFSTASSEYRFDLDPALVGNREVLDTWTTAAATIESLTSGRVKVQHASPYGWDGFVVVPADATPSCTRPEAPRLLLAGYCFGPMLEYFVAAILVAPPALTSPPVALRALLHAWGVHPHRMPGLLNSMSPADELSEFERKIVHLASLRGRVEWPDTER